MKLFGQGIKESMGAQDKVKAGPEVSQAGGMQMPAGMEIIPQITIGIEKATGRNVFICTLVHAEAIRIMAGAIQGLAAQLGKDGKAPARVVPPPGATIVDPTKR